MPSYGAHQRLDGRSRRVLLLQFGVSNACRSVDLYA
jgi:hypothetical protein